MQKEIRAVCPRCKETIQTLIDVLEELQSLQNGPPLLREEHKWRAVMARADRIIREAKGW